MLSVILLLLLQINCIQLPANSASLAVPAENVLFFVQGAADADAVVYILNVDIEGKINTNTPIRYLWLSDAAKEKSYKRNRTPDPNLYGLQSRQVDESQFEIKMNACDKIFLRLKRRADDPRYLIYVKDGDSDHLLKRIYMRIVSRKGRRAEIKHLDLVTLNSVSGIEFLKRISI